MEATVEPATITPLKFHGSSGEYFRIWIVNVLLTVATLGIYSPWAKVRRKQYLNRSTELAGSRFDYHANPVSILKGRLIAVPAFLTYVVGGYVFPGYNVLVLVLMVPLVPWIIVRSHMFNARNTSLRNIRFRFRRSYAGAYKLIFGYGLAVLFTIGILYPLFQFKLRKFAIDNSAFGTESFNTNASGSAFYGIYLRAVGLTAGALTCIGFVVLPAVTLTATMFGTSEQTLAQLSTLIPAAISFVVYAGVFGYTSACVANLMIGATLLGPHRLVSSVQARRLVWIYASNAIAIALTAGLAIPWATIRTLKYRLACTSVDLAPGFDAIPGVATQNVNAVGEEIGDFFDFDFGL